MAIKTRPEVAPIPSSGCGQRVRTTTLSKQLDTSKAALIRMAKAGLLPMPIKLGKLYLWDVKAVEAALQASKGGSDA